MHAHLKALMVVALAAIIPQCLQAGSSAREVPFIVSASWLADHLADKNLVLIHIGLKPQFDSAHIPGAQFLTRDQISTPRGQGLTLELPPVNHLDSVFESYGVSNSSHIVLYFGKDWISPTARVYLTLDYLGLGDRTSILDGGMPAWIEEGRELTDVITQPKRGHITPHPRKEIIAHLSRVKLLQETSHARLLDTRTPNYYTGKDTGMGSRPGHIPGARNLPFTEVIDDHGRFRNPETLRTLFAAEGVASHDTVITYCHIGQQASLVYFIARMLGYNAQLYDGSFEEWGTTKELPVALGEESPRKK